jgi:hypothetical protein
MAQSKPIWLVFILICFSTSNSLFAADIELPLNAPALSGTVAGGTDTLGDPQYFIVLPENATVTALKIDLNSTLHTNNIDLYVRVGERVIPTGGGEFTFDFRSIVLDFGAGIESVTITSPTGGRIYIGIINREAFDVDFTLTATATSNLDGFDVELRSGVPISDTISFAEFFGSGNGRQYFIDVPVDAAGLRVILEPDDPNLNFDLYTRFNQRIVISRATGFQIDSVSLSGGAESLTLLPPQSGRYYIGVANMTPSKASFTLTTTVTNDPNGFDVELKSGISVSGTVLDPSPAGLALLGPLLKSQYFIEVPAGAERLSVELKPSSFDVDLNLYLRRGVRVAPSTSRRALADFGSSTPATGFESIAVNTPPAGRYYIGIENYQLATFQFRTDARFRNDLNEGRLPADLRQEFEANGISLSPTTIVSVEERNNWWQIIDANRPEEGYDIRNAGTELNISFFTFADVPFTLTATVHGIEPPPPHRPWDINKDGVVDIFDLVKVANQFGQQNAELEADVNGDGIVNLFDLVSVAANFGEQAEPQAPLRIK